MDTWQETNSFDALIFIIFKWHPSIWLSACISFEYISVSHHTLYSFSRLLVEKQASFSNKCTAVTFRDHLINSSELLCFQQQMYYWPFLCCLLVCSACNIDLKFKHFRYVSNEEECVINNAICIYVVDSYKDNILYEMKMICCIAKDKQTGTYCTAFSEDLGSDTVHHHDHVFQKCTNCCTFVSIKINGTVFEDVFCSCRLKDISITSDAFVGILWRFYSKTHWSLFLIISIYFRFYC